MQNCSADVRFDPTSSNVETLRYPPVLSMKNQFFKTFIKINETV